MRTLSSVFLLCVMFTWPAVATAQDLVVSGSELVIDSDTEVDGSVIVEDGGTLTIRNATLRLLLDYDEEHRIDVAGDSRLVIDNGQIESTGGQYWIELYGDDGGNPTLEVSGDETWITNHSGIRPYDGTEIFVTGGDVEELQVRDQVTVQLTNAAAYPVFFFDGQTATLDGLDTGSNINNTIAVPGSWSMQLGNANIEGYQIDLINGANVTLANGDGIVLSVHTPGDLGSDLQVVEGVTSEDPISGSLTNLGSEFYFTDSNIALINVYVFGQDRVLLRDLHVNEVNAEQTSELIIGQAGYLTTLNCNLCQVYDHANFTVDGALIDASDNLPSATASYADFEDVGYGVMTFRDMDLRNLDLTVREHGTMNLHNCQYDPARLVILGDDATFNDYALAVDFVASPLAGSAPLAVTFRDLTSGDIDSHSWDFGDGATATAANPTHIYSDQGSYTVTLTVTGPAGSGSKVRSDYIVVSGSQPTNCVGQAMFLAAAAHISGAGGSVWRTDLAAFNPGSQATTLAMAFLPRDSDNSAVDCIAARTVAAEAAVHFNDLLSGFFGVDEGAGGVAIYSDSGAEIVLTSRTYNQTADGTFGQSIPGRSAAEGIADGDTGVLIGLFENQAYRTNIGFLNTAATSSDVLVELYGEDGSYLGERTLTLAPGDQHQENRILAGFTSGELSNARAEITVTGGPVLAYASVVDNKTSDPSYIEPW